MVGGGARVAMCHDDGDKIVRHVGELCGKARRDRDGDHGEIEIVMGARIALVTVRGVACESASHTPLHAVTCRCLRERIIHAVTAVT